MDVQRTILPKNIVISALTMKNVINPLGGILGKSEKTISRHKKNANSKVNHHWYAMLSLISSLAHWIIIQSKIRLIPINL
jgi:hypothetical protein